MEKIGDRYDKMEGHFSTGQSPQRAVAPMEEEGEEILQFIVGFYSLFYREYYTVTSMYCN